MFGERKTTLDSVSTDPGEKTNLLDEKANVLPKCVPPDSCSLLLLFCFVVVWQVSGVLSFKSYS